MLLTFFILDHILVPRIQNQTPVTFLFPEKKKIDKNNNLPGTQIGQ